MRKHEKSTQKEKCEFFHSLHQKGNPIVFPNIWDAGSAKTIADMGAQALATASWAVADSHGYKDGENIPFDLVKANAKRICDIVEIPVSIDLESGYGQTASEVGRFANEIMQTGAIGCNIEDSYPSDNRLRSIKEASARISAIRQNAIDLDIPFFINARTDVYFQPADMFSKTKAIDEIVIRASAYKASGANCIFVPRQLDLEIIKAIISQIELPLNIILSDDLSKIPIYAECGVSRVSMGPGAYLNSLNSLNKYKDLIATRP